MPETHATRFPVSRFSPSVRLLLRLVDGFSLPENAHTSCALAAAGGGVRGSPLDLELDAPTSGSIGDTFRRAEECCGHS